ncbi:hypothetical protein Q5O24_02610 [Eubacteriaceae bacterium ES3]|nr:hypothetical protein Q5O24_02610 [Eubacteriaceae bacterium ES3]
MNQTQNAGKTKLSLSLFIGGIIAALFGATNIIVSIVMFKDNLDYYVSMGYDSSEVMGQLFPTQLLPTLLEGVVLYGGIALLLFFASVAYQKLTLMSTESLEAIEISTELTDMTSESASIEGDYQEEISATQEASAAETEADEKIETALPGEAEPEEK